MNHFHLFLFGFFVFLSCSDAEEKQPNSYECDTSISTSNNTIWPLGASRVEGFSPFFESYRYDLWKLLSQDDFVFDFIGTECDESEYSNSNFDRNHQGLSGWTSSQLLSNMDLWLTKVGNPDYVLLSSPGGNDALQNLSIDQAISNINAIIDKIQDAHEEVIIIIELLAPGKSTIMNSEMQANFSKIHQAVLEMEENQTNSKSQVIAVNMFDGFKESFLADDVHYNKEGAQFIAQKYYEVLKPILLK